MEIYKFKCKNCGSKEYIKIDDSTYKCPYCGYKEEVFLNNSIKEQDKMLSEEDWQKINESNLENNKKTKKFSNNTFLFIMCLFLGCFGVHKFLEKKYFAGIIYFLTVGLLYIGWIIDIVKYLGILIKENKPEH